MTLVLLAFVAGTLSCLKLAALPAPAMLAGLATGSATGMALMACRRRVLPGPASVVGPVPAAAAAAHDRLRRRRGVRWRRRVATSLLLLAVAALGMANAAWHGRAALSARLPQELAARTLTVEARVIDLPQRIDDGWRLRLRIERAVGSERIEGLQARVACPDERLADSGVPQAGERWQFELRLRPPRGLANEGLFDYEGWLTTQRIGATGYCRGEAERLAPTPTVGPLAWRARIATAIDGLAAGQRERALLRALAVGDGRALTAEDNDILTATGTIHLVSVSGLHIGLVGLGAAALLRGLLLRLPSRGSDPTRHRWLAELAGLGLAALYVLLAGAGVPAQRALLMLAIASWVRAAGMGLGPARVLLLTLVLVLLVDPLAGLSAGAWLSFTAVAVLLATSGRAACPWPVPWSWLGPQAAVAVGLAPLLADLGEAQPRLGFVANLLAIPWVGMVCTPLALGGALLELLQAGAGGWAWWLGAWTLEPVLPVLAWLAARDAGGWRPELVDLPARIAFALACALLLLPRGLPVKLPATALLLALMLPRDPRPLPAGAFEMEVFDVGQGTAIAIRTLRHLLIYDTGPRFSEAFDPGRAVIAARLLREGRRRVDRLMVSHGDADHIGGAPGLMAVLPVRGLDTSVPDRFGERAPLPAACRAGSRWQWDDVRFQVLHPPDASRRWQGNNGSCVLRVEGSWGRVLLPGDIEERAESWLRRHARESLAAEVVVLPHHGSRTSSSLGWARATGARWVISTTGFRNRFRHPHAKVIERWQRLGAEHLDTARDGALRLRFGPGGISVRRERHDAPRWWRG